MDRKTLEAKATTTDQGEFTALAATYSVDRMNERILPGAFKGTIADWRESGKNIPLHWDHMGDAHNIIGTVDPSSMEETAKGLQVKGQLDLEESDVARDAWRLMKKNAVALSFGYLVTSDGKAEDGVRELKSVDLFEITITPAPANPDTRFIDMKSQTDKTEGVERPAEEPDEGTKAMDPATMGERMGAMAEEMASGDFDAEAMASQMRDMGKALHAEAAWRDWAAKHLKAEEPEQKAEELTETEAEIEDRGEEPEEAKLPQDPLTQYHDDTVFELTTRGVAISQPVAEKKVEPPTEPPPSLEELEGRLRGIEVDILTRGDAI